MKNSNYEMDMCHGPLLTKILIFSIPLMLSSVLQLLFNAADIVVVGRFAGETSLAAVGSTSALINLLTNLFLGLSLGTNVVLARYYGAKNEKAISETIHTAILASLICGVVLAVLGYFLSGFFLLAMGTPENVLPKATLYMKIYFLGMPVMMVYDFGSAILRALGDTRRPLYFLSIAGVLNIVLNICFTIGCAMDVAGVALATVISQCLSAFLILKCLRHQKGCFALDLKKLHIYPDKFFKMLQVGLPAGLQGTIFSISNVLIQSSVNSFGKMAIAGNTAAANIEGFVYVSMNAFYQTNLTFTSQNVGGKQYHRIHKILFACQGLVIAVGVLLGYSALYFSHELLGIYTNSQEVVDFGLMRMRVICSTYFICGMMDVMVGSLRGLGYSILPMIVSLIGACGLRIVWLYTVFRWHRSLFVLYLSYPVTWIITVLAHIICYVIVKRKYFKIGGNR